MTEEGGKRESIRAPMGYHRILAVLRLMVLV